MDTVTSKEIQQTFGDTIRRAQQAPIQITSYGRPVAVLMSIESYQKTEEFKAQYLKEKIERGLADIEAGAVFDGDEVFREVLAGNYD